MATTVKMHEAKTHLSSLIARMEQGEDIVIARGNVAVAKLVPVEPQGSMKPKRQFGSLAGRISIPDSFFDPMTEEELRLWEGE